MDSVICLPPEIYDNVFVFVDDIIFLFRCMIISRTFCELIHQVIKRNFCINNEPKMRQINFHLVNKSGFWNKENEISKNKELTIILDSGLRIKQLIPFLLDKTYENAFNYRNAEHLFNVLWFCTTPYPFYFCDLQKAIDHYDDSSHISEITSNVIYVNHVDRLKYSRGYNSDFENYYNFTHHTIQELDYYRESVFICEQNEKVYCFLKKSIII